MNGNHNIPATLLMTTIMVIVTGFTMVGGRVSAQENLDWPTLSFQEIANGLDLPVHLTHAGDGSNRLFIVEQAGMIVIFKNNALISEPFLDIQARVRSPRSGGSNEEGLLSVAFPPGFDSSTNYFFVYYTNKAGDNQVSRFSLSSNPDKADINSEEVVLYLNHPQYSNHNGGQLSFGPDGYLYIGTGDGGGGGDPFDNAQDSNSLLGKILRIDVEMAPPPGFTPTNYIYLPITFQGDPAATHSLYRIPETNPFVGVDGYREEIWALGLRNPWRFSFDRSSGDLFIGDVGQNKWEEIDYQPANSTGGENYGWNIMEGDQCYETTTCDMTGLIMPIFVYSHTSGCSVSGGYTYRGQEYPAYQGIYLFADFCSGRIWGLQKSVTGWDNQELSQVVYSISSFGEDEYGELYLLDHQGDNGSVYKIILANQ